MSKSIEEELENATAHLDALRAAKEARRIELEAYVTKRLSIEFDKRLNAAYARRNRLFFRYHYEKAGDTHD